jgi:hypothetical protein
MAPIGGFATTIITAGAYLKFGAPEQKDTVLRGITRGRVEAISMSEPEAGSDVANLSCRALKVDGGWLVNGQKTWCSNAHFADHILLVARTSSESGRGHQGLTMFMVPADTEGLTVRGIDTVGGREVNDLFFTDCFLPDEAVVGAVDQAWRQLMVGLNWERVIMSALLLGTAQRAFDDTLSFVTQRKQFGRPIGSFQALSPAGGPRHRDRAPPAGVRRGPPGRRRTGPDPPPGSLDGEAEGDGDGEAHGDRGHADDGWLRLRKEFDMGRPSPSSPRSTAVPARSSGTSSARRSASELGLGGTALGLGGSRSGGACVHRARPRRRQPAVDRRPHWPDRADCRVPRPVPMGPLVGDNPAKGGGLHAAARAPLAGSRVGRRRGVVSLATVLGWSSGSVW